MTDDYPEQRSQAETDFARATLVVRELLDEFPDPHTGEILPGLLTQAWNLKDDELLAKRRQDDGDSGGYRKPGSRPPSSTLLTLMADVQRCLDYAHQVAADDFGSFVNSAEKETALRRLPDLLYTSLGDCHKCERCTWKTKDPCICRHRQVVKKLNKQWSTIGADLGYWEHPVEKPLIECPGCGKAGQVVIRKDQERMYCRYEDCTWERTGIFAILAVAS